MITWHWARWTSPAVVSVRNSRKSTHQYPPIGYYAIKESWWCPSFFHIIVILLHKHQSWMQWWWPNVFGSVDTLLTWFSCQNISIYSLSKITWRSPTIFFPVWNWENEPDKQAPFTPDHSAMVESSAFTHICACLTHSFSLKPVRKWVASVNLPWTDYTG